MVPAVVGPQLNHSPAVPSPPRSSEANGVGTRDTQVVSTRTKFLTNRKGEKKGGRERSCPRAGSALEDLLEEAGCCKQCLSILHP